ncbi:hypothetical protein FBR06_02415 [Betaproteobacteria bacterium PRO4]|uniref:hypothetical protein n=1 Tax=Nitrosomonas sp. TaxID=42353 RepID=UPI002564AE03|nr:hypothetical protein [Nitrosomonas sp.]MDL1866106.1 hypothetical protein [Betaproteobacteria bacterium PRO4]
MAESTFEAGYCQLIIDGQKSIFTLWFIGLGEIDPLVEKVFFAIFGMVFQVFFEYVIALFILGRIGKFAKSNYYKMGWFEYVFYDKR